MAEQEVAAPAADLQSSDPRADWKCLLVLLALIVPLRVWLLYNTEVAARDSIGFIRYALDFENPNKSWAQVVNSYDQHPGFPFCVWLMSVPVRAVAGLDPDTMRLSAQLVSVLAALLLIPPLYFLGKELFDRQIGFWGTLIFQYLPTSGHLLSDGISEALYLLQLVTALWFAARAMRTASVRDFAACGLFGGLAYLVRPEGAIVVLALGLAWCAKQVLPAGRCGWKNFLQCGFALALAASLTGGLYVLATGRITTKPAAGDILNNLRVGTPATLEVGPTVEVAPSLFAMLPAVWLPRTDDAALRWRQSWQALAMEISNGLFFVGWVPPLLGFCWFGHRLLRHPGFWAVALYLLLHGLVLVRLAMLQFYVSERHVLVLVLFCTYLLAVGLREMPPFLVALLRIRTAESPWYRRPALWSLVWLIGMVVICLPKTTERLHGNRAGNLAAGRWLTRQLLPGDYVDDDHAWSHYYAGKVFEEGRDPLPPPGYQPLSYVVLTRSNDPTTAALREERERQLREKGPLVYHWPEHRPVDEARVVVYAQPLPPPTRPRNPKN